MRTSKQISKKNFVKTGTTIAAAAFKDFIVLAADTRATEDELVANADCMKLHKITDKIFMAGSGVAADLDHLSHRLSCQMTEHKAKYNKVLVENAVKPFANKLFDHFGFLHVGVLIGGFDAFGTHLYSLSPNGYTKKVPFTSEGSGSTFAQTYLANHYNYNMTEAQAKELLCGTIEYGIKNDLFSGSTVNMVVIKRVGKKVITEEFLPYKLVSQFVPQTVPPVARLNQFECIRSVTRKIPHVVKEDLDSEVQQQVKRMEVTN